MRARLLAFLWDRLIPARWLRSPGARGSIARLCWRESFEQKDQERSTILWI